MAIAQRDANFKPVLIGALNTDGKTPINLSVNPSTHSVGIYNGSANIDHGKPQASRDENFVPVILGTSSVDGKTPVEIYFDSNGNMATQPT